MGLWNLDLTYSSGMRAWSTSMDMRIEGDANNVTVWMNADLQLRFENNNDEWEPIRGGDGDPVDMGYALDEDAGDFVLSDGSSRSWRFNSPGNGGKIKKYQSAGECIQYDYAQSRITDGFGRYIWVDTLNPDEPQFIEYDSSVTPQKRITTLKYDENERLILMTIQSCDEDGMIVATKNTAFVYEEIEDVALLTHVIPPGNRLQQPRNKSVRHQPRFVPYPRPAVSH